MGFLERLLKKEARKIISSVVDDVVDNVIDTIRDSDNDKETPNNTASAGTTPVATSVCGDEDRAQSAFDVANRIQKVVDANWGDKLEIRRNISPSEIAAEKGAMNGTFGFYYNGSLIAIANILDDGTDYWHKRVRLVKDACQSQGIGYTHFIMRLPNRISYIEEQLKKIINIPA